MKRMKRIKCFLWDDISLKCGGRNFILSLVSYAEIRHVMQISCPVQGILNCPQESSLQEKYGLNVVSLRSIYMHLLGGYFQVARSYSNMVNNSTKLLNETISLLCKMALETILSSLWYGEL